MNNQTASVANNLLDPQDLRAEYGNAISNVPNRFVVNAVLTSPWKKSGLMGYLTNDWELSPAYALQSGLPYNITTSGTLSTGVRPDDGQHLSANRWRHQRIERNLPCSRHRAQLLLAAEDQRPRPAHLQALLDC